MEVPLALELPLEFGIGAAILQLTFFSLKDEWFSPIKQRSHPSSIEYQKMKSNRRRKRLKDQSLLLIKFKAVLSRRTKACDYGARSSKAHPRHLALLSHIYL